MTTWIRHGWHGSGITSVIPNVDTPYWISLRCVIWGHDDHVRRAPGRLYLKCAECGRTTRGWDLTPRADQSRPEAAEEHPPRALAAHSR